MLSWQCSHGDTLVNESSGIFAQADRTYAREQTALRMRKAGAQFAEIGETLGVGPVRARQIYLRALARQTAERRVYWKHLSARAVRVLTDEGVAFDAPPNIVAQIDPANLKQPNIGKTTIKEISDWLDANGCGWENSPTKTSQKAIDNAIKFLESNGYAVTKLQPPNAR